ncbi:MAG: prephenate dehydrogenase [Clostridia bacterium]|nr:prephenate dehydrogenase [Clostridia bacterium]
MNLINKNNKVLIVGLGMLGASYAKALKKNGFYITAVTLDPDDIDYALEKGFIDRGYTMPLPEAISDADIVILALYPKVAIEWIVKNQDNLKSGAFITDVTGIKETVVKSINKILRPDLEFVPAHPMAGKEGKGIVQSDDEIFKYANYIITPTAKNTEEGIKKCEELGKILGFANISRLSIAEHDKVIAFVSQLTHCIAIALMGCDTCKSKNNMENYTGDSFRDLTRIAKINDSLWSELFSMNKKALLEQMDVFEESFNELRKMIENDDIDSMRKLMKKSTKRRTRFDKKQ